MSVGWAATDTALACELLSAAALGVHLLILRPRAARRDLLLDARIIQDELELAERLGQVGSDTTETVAVHQLLRRIRQNPGASRLVLDRIPALAVAIRGGLRQPDVEYLGGTLDRLGDAAQRYLRGAWPRAGALSGNAGQSDLGRIGNDALQSHNGLPADDALRSDAALTSVMSVEDTDVKDPLDDEPFDQSIVSAPPVADVVIHLPDDRSEFEVGLEELLEGAPADRADDLDGEDGEDGEDGGLEDLDGDCDHEATVVHPADDPDSDLDVDEPAWTAAEDTASMFMPAFDPGLEPATFEPARLEPGPFESAPFEPAHREPRNVDLTDARSDADPGSGAESDAEWVDLVRAETPRRNSSIGLVDRHARPYRPARSGSRSPARVAEPVDRSSVLPR